tara:strand:- start:1420 stop:1929 length:510 start_codon:yes stop_codon:yes gene_type:complete
MDEPLNTYIGIDPGLSGAIAFIGPDWYRVHDIPTMLKGTGKVKYEINSAGLQDILYKDLPNHSVAGLERVNAMPGQGVSSVFSLGDSFGCCRSVLACAQVPTFYVTPTEWKKYFRLTSDKEEARAMAIKLYPKAELHLKKHVDRAEALLIATFIKFKVEKAKNDSPIFE